MATKPAAQLTIGSLIMPPAREVSLWMRRRLADKGLPESALYLTVVSIRDGQPDKAGPWLVFTTTHAPAWNGAHPYSFTFKARPQTLWTEIRPGTGGPRP